MKSDSIAFALAGVAFGLIAGWVIGTQQATPRAPVAAPAQASAPAANGSGGTRAALLDEAQVTALKNVATREPANAQPRAQLANLYFDAERYDDAITWYTEALKLTPNDVNVRTDLGVCYYYLNQPDKALEQFDQSLKLRSRPRQDAAQPRHRAGVRQAGSRRRDPGLAEGVEAVSGRSGRAGRQARARHAAIGARGRRWHGDTETWWLMLRVILLLVLVVLVARTFWRVIDGLIEGISGRGATNAAGPEYAAGSRSGVRHLGVAESMT